MDFARIGDFPEINFHFKQRLIMTNSIVEILIGYVVVITLFTGLPTIVLTVVFLPGLMRTTGETIGTSDRMKGTAVVAQSATVLSRPGGNRTSTRANTT